MANNRSFDRLAAMAAFFTRRKTVGCGALNKLLWFADLAHFLQHGRTISGATYGRHDYGPYPDEIDVVRLVLIREDLIEETIQELKLYRVFFYKARHANINWDLLEKEFSVSELTVIQKVKRILRAKPSKYLSQMSRQFEPWISAGPGEDLDWNLVASDPALREWMTSIGLLPAQHDQPKRKRWPVK